MLFDLRGRGRRRTIQAIYLSLAILMGGGLVLFGIGGATSGGLVDAISGSGNSSVDQNVYKDKVAKLQKQLVTDPKNETALADLYAKKPFPTFGYHEYIEMLADFLERNARRLDQTLNRDLNFQPLDFGIGDARHGGSFFQSLPECLMGYLSKTGLKINNPAAVCYSR